MAQHAFGQAPGRRLIAHEMARLRGQPIRQQDSGGVGRIARELADAFGGGRRRRIVAGAESADPRAVHRCDLQLRLAELLGELERARDHRRLCAALSRRYTAAKSQRGVEPHLQHGLLR